MPKVQPGPRKGRPTAKSQSQNLHGAGVPPGRSHMEGSSARGSKSDTPPGVWEARARLWVVVGGLNALGPGKVRLLEAIAATKSLSAAAKRLRMSYRAAWKHLRFIEERTRITVVEPRRGGRDGGGTDLTPQGKALLDAYRNFHREVEEHTEAACRRYFARWSSPPRDPDKL